MMVMMGFAISDLRFPIFRSELANKRYWMPSDRLLEFIARL